MSYNIIVDSCYTITVMIAIINKHIIGRTAATILTPAPTEAAMVWNSHTIRVIEQYYYLRKVIYTGVEFIPCPS